MLPCGGVLTSSCRGVGHFCCTYVISLACRKLDAELVRPSVQGLDVPKEAESMLTMKRG